MLFQQLKIAESFPTMLTRDLRPSSAVIVLHVPLQYFQRFEILSAQLRTTELISMAKHMENRILHILECACRRYRTNTARVAHSASVFVWLQQRFVVTRMLGPKMHHEFGNVTRLDATKTSEVFVVTRAATDDGHVGQRRFNWIIQKLIVRAVQIVVLLHDRHTQIGIREVLGKRGGSWENSTAVFTTEKLNVLRDFGQKLVVFLHVRAHVCHRHRL